MLNAKILFVYGIMFVATLLMGFEVKALYLDIINSFIENKASEMKSLPQDVIKSISFDKLSETYHIPVLMYHYVEYVKDARDTIRKSLDTTPDMFENQVKTFHDAGYEFLTMSDIADIVLVKKTAPVKSVALTFDDGYRDFYTDVMPILSKYQAKATVFIISDFMDKPNYMFTNQLQEITGSGLVEIGAHTQRHENLKGKLEDQVRRELIGSKIKLETIIGIPVVSFAYPYGAFDNQVIRIVKESGYLSAVSTIEGIGVTLTDRYFVPRIRPGRRIGEQLLTFIENTK